MVQSIDVMALEGRLEDAAFWILDFAVKGFLILALVACILLALKRASAATRSLVIMVAMMSLLLLPVLTLLVPQWRLPSAQVERVFRYLPKDVDKAHIPIAGTDEMLLVETTAASVSAPVVTTAPTGSEWTFQRFLVLTCGLGSLVLLIRLVASVAGVSILSWRSTQITEGRLLEALEKQKSSLGVDRDVILLTSEKRSMPMTWGTLTPTILLPTESAVWSREHLEAVLLHELAHIRRADCLMQLLSQLACAIHWFNPLVWLASWRMGIERERATDDLVLQSGVLAPDYAEVLLQTSAAMRPSYSPAIAAVAMARPTGIEKRLKTVLDSSLNRSRPRAVLVSTIVVSATMLLIPLAMLRADEKKNSGDSKSDSSANAVGTDGSVPERPTTHSFRDQLKLHELDKEILTLESQLSVLKDPKRGGLEQAIGLGINPNLLTDVLRQYDVAKRAYESLNQSGAGPGHPDSIFAKRDLDRAAAGVKSAFEDAKNYVETRLKVAVEKRDRYTASQVNSRQSSLVRVATPQAGIVKRVEVKPGQIVEKGDFLIHLADTQARGKVELAKQQLEFALLSKKLQQEAVDAAQETLEMFMKQSAAGLSSSVNVAAARKELRTEKGKELEVESEIRRAELQLSLAEDELAQLSVRAPMKGKVTEVLCHPGEYVSPTSPVVIIELGSTRVEAGR